jgi:hypothetical protein
MLIIKAKHSSLESMPSSELNQIPKKDLINKIAIPRQTASKPSYNSMLRSSVLSHKAFSILTEVVGMNHLY